MRRTGKLEAGQASNRDFAKNDGAFRAACLAAGVEPTKRQASKFRLGKGAAIRAARKAGA